MHEIQVQRSNKDEIRIRTYHSSLHWWDDESLYERCLFLTSKYQSKDDET